MKVWLVELADYEQSYIIGVWSSKERAVEGLKANYPPPFIVRWEEPSTNEWGTSISGHFEAVPGKSTRHQADYRIWSEVVDGPETGSEEE